MNDSIIKNSKLKALNLFKAIAELFALSLLAFITYLIGAHKIQGTKIQGTEPCKKEVN